MARYLGITSWLGNLSSAEMASYLAMTGWLVGWIHFLCRDGFVPHHDGVVRFKFKALPGSVWVGLFHACNNIPQLSPRSVTEKSVKT